MVIWKPQLRSPGGGSCCSQRSINEHPLNNFTPLIYIMSAVCYLEFSFLYRMQKGVWLVACVHWKDAISTQLVDVQRYSHVIEVSNISSSCTMNASTINHLPQLKGIDWKDRVKLRQKWKSLLRLFLSTETKKWELKFCALPDSSFFLCTKFILKMIQPIQKKYFLNPLVITLNSLIYIMLF